MFSRIASVRRLPFSLLAAAWGKFAAHAHRNTFSRDCTILIIEMYFTVFFCQSQNMSAENRIECFFPIHRASYVEECHSRKFSAKGAGWGGFWILARLQPLRFFLTVEVANLSSLTPHSILFSTFTSYCAWSTIYHIWVAHSQRIPAAQSTFSILFYHGGLTLTSGYLDSLHQSEPKVEHITPSLWPTALSFVQSVTIITPLSLQLSLAACQCPFPRKPIVSHRSDTRKGF